MADHVEQAGSRASWALSSVMAGQHFLSDAVRDGPADPAARAHRRGGGAMRVGTGVLLLPLLNPLQVAEEIATLDAITGGRAVLGVGIGYRDVELAGFGVTASRRRSSRRSSTSSSACSPARR